MLVSAVYPACAGIDRSLQPRKKRRDRLPRMRGDRPAIGPIGFVIAQFTPHARGSTCILKGYKKRGEVYPACAGIDHAS